MLRMKFNGVGVTEFVERILAPGFFYDNAVSL